MGFQNPDMGGMEFSVFFNSMFHPPNKSFQLGDRKNSVFPRGVFPRFVIWPLVFDISTLEIKFSWKMQEILFFGLRAKCVISCIFQEKLISKVDISITKGHMTKRGKRARGNTLFFRSPKGFVRRMNHRIEKILKIPYPPISGFWNPILYIRVSKFQYSQSIKACFLSQ